VPRSELYVLTGTSKCSATERLFGTSPPGIRLSCIGTSRIPLGTLRDVPVTVLMTLIVDADKPATVTTWF
jgi:hypothetical protein